jgi:protein AaeX
MTSRAPIRTRSWLFTSAELSRSAMLLSDIALISTQEHRFEVRRGRSARRLFAPISVMMVAAWFVTVVLRRVAGRFGLLAYVWHPALFVFTVYIIALSLIVLVIAR